MIQESKTPEGFYDDEAIDSMLEQCFTGQNAVVSNPPITTVVPEALVVRESSNVSSKGSSIGVNHSFVQVDAESCKAVETPASIPQNVSSQRFDSSPDSLLDSPKDRQVSAIPEVKKELFTVVREEPVVSAPIVAPVRGRVFTQPAWMTVGLPDESDDSQSSLSVMESEIEKVKAEIAQLAVQIEDKKRQRDALRQRYAAQIQQTPARFVVNLEKTPATPLGLSVGFDAEQGCFLVNEVKPHGCVPEYNRMCRDASQKIYPQDAILAVNGVRGDRVAMTTQFASPRIQLEVRVGDHRKPNMPNNIGDHRQLHRRPDMTGEVRGDMIGQHRQSPNMTGAVRDDIIGNHRGSANMNEEGEVYEEIMDAIRKRDFQKTGIMNAGDVPFRLPCEQYVCHVCNITCRDWRRHFHSTEHSDKLAQIPSRDYWTKYALNEQGTLFYWYEHKMGFWSIVDPNENRSGCHTST